MFDALPGNGCEPFASFFIAGFECSSMKRWDGVRLDLLQATQHDLRALVDYEAVRSHGLGAARDGLRWHRIEICKGVYDWSSWLPMLCAARRAGVQVIWDLCHYGWPDHVDIWSGDFIDSFTRYARAAAKVQRDMSDEVPIYCPINEISYWAWAGGEVGRMAPAAFGRGDELKKQLARAYISAVAAIREVDPRARFIVAEPLIHVVSASNDPQSLREAEHHRQAQFSAHHMLIGASCPELGGRPAFLDIVGVNFYPNNQWYLGGATIPLGHHAYRSLHSMLDEVYRRFNRPLLIAETGAEGSGRPYWLHHVCAETFRAMRASVPVIGVCLYPVLDYPGWEDERVCEAGLLSMPDSSGVRRVAAEYLNELHRQCDLIGGYPCTTAV